MCSINIRHILKIEKINKQINDSVMPKTVKRNTLKKLLHYYIPLIFHSCDTLFAYVSNNENIFFYEVIRVYQIYYYLNNVL